MKQRAIAGILEKARAVLGGVSKPEKKVVVGFDEFVESGMRGELDLDETVTAQLEEATSLPKGSLRFATPKEKEIDIALVMDSSLSMSGEKIALLAVAVAVVALSVPSARLALMGFDSKSRWVKKFGGTSQIKDLIEKILELPAAGFTNLEQALVDVSKVLASRQSKKTNVILISDGKYTEGKDPLYLATRFQHLNILKIGKDQAGRELLLDLAKMGHGKFFEARKISDLPRTMYGAVRTLLQ